MRDLPLLSPGLRRTAPFRLKQKRSEKEKKKWKLARESCACIIGPSRAAGGSQSRLCLLYIHDPLDLIDGRIAFGDTVICKLKR